MRESVGSTWVFSIVIVFTLIFSGFLVLVLSYSKAYKLKNEMTTIIEKYEGLTKSNISKSDSRKDWGSIKIINNYLLNSGYATKGKCDSGAYGVKNLNMDDWEDANSNTDYYYCIKMSCNTDHEAIYTITVFYNFNLPVIGQIYKYRVSGQTHYIAHPNPAC